MNARDILDKELTYLPGVGPRRAELLRKELGVVTFYDLLQHFPFKYIDRSRFYRIAEIDSEMPAVQIRGFIRGYVLEGQGKGKRLTAEFADETGSLRLVWFKGVKWISGTYPPGKEYIILGKPNVFGGTYNIIHPEIEAVDKITGRKYSSLQAHYSLTENLRNNFITSRVISKLIGIILAQLGTGIPETLPQYLVKKYRLASLSEAMSRIHFPDNLKEIDQARYRLKFEELFYIQLNLVKQKSFRNTKTIGIIFDKVGEHLNSFYKKHLPFELTDAQKKVIREIRRDMKSGHQMNRLLQGDVGSGKTVVALMCMLIAADNGYQSCLMAPTEILAFQHFNSINGLLKEMNLTIRLLTGSTRKKEREEIGKRLLDGSLDILVGTHALIEDNVVFRNLGFVVIDEQHRFGVAQRGKLWQKSLTPPHVLVMTATPIPRTLAMTLYGDLDVSVINQLPPGRKPVMTMHYFDSSRETVYGFIRKQIREGRQVYVVYPLIMESEKMDYKALEEGLVMIESYFPAPEYAISVVHGRMPVKNKERSMDLFKKGITHIMVATTVIEVGVDIPNASVMVIESAERFGLSQLHQLRGRVGRGADQSYCILLSDNKLSREAARRLEIMVSTTDGFEISEADLQLRGPGDIEGTQQSGMPFNLKIADLGKDGALIEYVRRIAGDVINIDPSLESPENLIMKNRLEYLFSRQQSWRMIS
ncbi:MAG: ATP-dependent DNA helicase RecG [Bacteroidales bacterium]|jgi:ATP-dependent DNA helicase RecG|nr:ATP-dependent DNA helicase RecG [Bacteroidales bacterium]